MMEWMPSCSTVTMTSHIPCTPPLRRTYKKLPGPKDPDRDIQKHHLIPTWVLKKLGIKPKEGRPVQMDKADHALSKSTAAAGKPRHSDRGYSTSSRGEISVERSKTACRTWS